MQAALCFHRQTLKGLIFALRGSKGTGGHSLGTQGVLRWGSQERHPGKVPWKGVRSERQVWTWVMVRAWSWARLYAVCGEIATGECRAACGTGDGLEVTSKQSQMGPGPQSNGRSALKAQGCSRERVCPAWGWQEAASHLEG